MPLCPFATWRPISTNFGGPMGKVYGLVLHVQEGNNSLYGWFNNPAANVSAHFWCSKSGTLEQYLNPPGQTAWAQAAGNPNYVSVECEGYATEAMTPAQLACVASLLDWCAGTFGFPVGGPVAHGSQGFTQHCNLNGTPDPAWGNHICPGPIRLGQEPAIVAAAREGPPSEGEKMQVGFVPGSSKAYFCVTGNGAVFAFGGAIYKGGVNNAGPGGTTALPPGDVVTSVAVCAADGYLIGTAQDNLYAFGTAQFSGKP
jgi:N-acetylmuramoyl-L-alanine amidase